MASDVPSPLDSDVPAATTSPIPGLPADWPQQATNRVVSVVDDVRAKTSGPAIHIGRAVVFGLLAFFALLVMIPIFLIGAIRGLQQLLDTFWTGEIYPVYLILGALFCVAGLFAWSRRPKGAAVPKI